MKKKNKNKALGWWQNLNAGDPEKNMEIFNHMMTDHPSQTSESPAENAMAEAIKSIIENPETNLEALKALDYINEKWISEKELDEHFQKHCIGIIYVDKYGNKKLDTTFVYYPQLKDKRQYEKEAEKLQETPIDNKRIKGYQAGDCFIKYDTKTQDFVIYILNEDNEKRSISYYKLRNAFEYVVRRNEDESNKGSIRDLNIGESLDS